MSKCIQKITVNYYSVVVVALYNYSGYQLQGLEDELESAALSDGG